jgi:hypothetical protein
MKSRWKKVGAEYEGADGMVVTANFVYIPIRGMLMRFTIPELRVLQGQVTGTVNKHLKEFKLKL